MIADPGTRAWALAVALAATASPSSSRSRPRARRRRGDAHRRDRALGRIGGDGADAALEKIHGDESEPDAIKLAAWKAFKRLLHACRRRTPRVRIRAARRRVGGRERRDEVTTSDDEGDDDDDDDDEGDDDDDEGDDDE